MFKHLILSTFLIFNIALADEQSSVKEANVIEITTSSGGLCSLTVLKSEGQCRGVTNAHCLNNDDQSVTANFRESNKAPSKHRYPNPKNHQFIHQSSAVKETNYYAIYQQEKPFYLNRFDQKSDTLEVKRIDRTRDLAEIAVPNSYCENVKEISKEATPVQEKNSCGHFVVGFSREDSRSEPSRRVSYNNSSKFKVSLYGIYLQYSEAKISKERSVYSNLEDFLVLHETPILPGNSGGASFDCESQFLGISSRQNQSQDLVYVIPKDDVLKFLDSDYSSTEIELNFDNSTHPVGGNSGTGTSGGNSGTRTTGGNSGTGTSGGNSGTGTDSKVEIHQDDFLFFLEPEEGVKLESENAIRKSLKVLVGFNNFQIDGMDDLYQHYIDSKDTDVCPIFRNENGLLPSDVMQGLLNRLTGDYTFKDSKVKLYRPNSKHYWGYSPLGINKRDANINVKADEISIEFEDTHDVFESPNKIDNISGAAQTLVKKIDFKISENEDSSEIYLTAGNVKLTCKNSNYLKLICQNDRVQFSISKDSEKSQDINFRLAYKHKGLVYYSFGESENESR